MKLTQVFFVAAFLVSSLAVPAPDFKKLTIEAPDDRTCEIILTFGIFRGC